MLLKAQEKLDTEINARIESETETKKDLIDIIKYGQGNLDDGESDGFIGNERTKVFGKHLAICNFGAVFFMMFMMLFLEKVSRMLCI